MLTNSCSNNKLKKITILHTNDVHSHIDPFDKDNDKFAFKGGVSRRATIIEKIRKENSNTLLLDAGDIFQGTPYFNFYAGELAQYRRQHPGDDVVSTLLAITDEQGAITTEEFETMFFLFAVAGNETLRNGIPGGMLALLKHPDQMNKLINNQELLPSAVEEMLRYAPPVIHFRRTATEDLKLGNTQIRKGDKVVVYHAGANRDPQVFEDPDEFNIERTPNDHVTFGAGPHFCLGAHLARMQMTAIFKQALARLPNLSLNGKPEHLVSNFQNGLKHLPIKWGV